MGANKIAVTETVGVEFPTARATRPGAIHIAQRWTQVNTA